MMEEQRQELPSGWFETTLDDVAMIEAGNPAPQGEKFFRNGKFSFVRVQDMGRLGNSSFLRITKDSLNEEGIKRLKLFAKGSVLFTKSGASTLLNQRAILGQDSYVVSHIGVAIPQGNILSEWIFHWLKIIDFANYAHGANMPSMPLSKAKEIRIPIAPLNEQKRIADKIERLFSDLDEGEALLKTVLKQLATYRHSVLKAAVTGELTKDWREKNQHRLESGEDLLKRILKTRRDNWNGRGQYKEPKAPDLGNLPKLPDGWVWVSLESLISSGPQNGIYLPKDKYGNGIPILRIDDFQTGWVRDANSLLRVSASKEEHQLYFLNVGDIVVNRVNSVSHLGKSTLIESTHKGCIYESNMMRFTISPDICREYISLYLSSAMGRKRVIANCKHAVNQASINQQDVKAVPIPFPTNIEQLEIANLIQEIISKIDVLVNWCATELARSNTLRQSILKSAFSGKLVPQNPKDEPASELLKRIQAERNKQPKPKPKSIKSKRKKAEVA